MLDEMHSVKEAMPAIGSLPEDIDAVFFLPAPLRTADMKRLTEAPTSFSSPVGASYPITPSVFVTLAFDLVKVGKPSAQFAHLISQGVKPTDLPVDTADFLVALYLETAQTIGLTVPDDLRCRADAITH